MIMITHQIKPQCAITILVTLGLFKQVILFGMYLWRHRMPTPYFAVYDSSSFCGRVLSSRINIVNIIYIHFGFRSKFAAVQLYFVLNPTKCRLQYNFMLYRAPWMNRHHVIYYKFTSLNSCWIVGGTTVLAWVS